MRKIIIFVILLNICNLGFAPEVSSSLKLSNFDRAISIATYNKQYLTAINLVKKFEGLSLIKYWDVTQFSIGYGHAIKPGENFNIITEEEAELLLHLDFELAIRVVEENTNLSRYDYPNKVLSLASFVFNVGEGNFINSTLLIKLKANESINEEFLKWVKVKSNGQPIVSYGLIKRRTLELILFHS